MNFISSSFKYLRNKKKFRKFILLFNDTFIFFISTHIAKNYFESNIQIGIEFNQTYYLYLSVIIIGLLIYYLSNQYKPITKYFISRSLYGLGLRNLLLLFFIFILNSFFLKYTLGIKFFALLWLIITFLTGATRIVIRDIINFVEKCSKNSKSCKNVVIYGAGSAGSLLLDSLNSSGQFIVRYFIDEDVKKIGRTIKGISIKGPNDLEKIRKNVDLVLIAIPSINKIKRSKIIQRLLSNDIPSMEIPSLEELTEKKYRIDSFKPVTYEDFLGRREVLTENDLMAEGISNSVVCVTGAGGSIGKELSRQLIQLKPSKLILVDMSEHSLYQIEKELNQFSKNDQLFTCKLGNLCDKAFVNRIFQENSIDIVFHAAAYKHVPLLERNSMVALQNNLFSTKNLCDASFKNNIKKFVLISTDKAVRPTNIMGSSKRIAELITKSFDKTSKDSKLGKSTLFSIVRFGNVIGSSGSVIPLFKEQISSGGPVTITDFETTRYFMTIQEASQLVLQASIIANGGDIFILEMGSPILIKVLAEQMIKLSGLTIKSKNNPGGDIEIIETGLREGEKLHEELLINGEKSLTQHPMIYRANEIYEFESNFWDYLDHLMDAIEKSNSKKCMQLIREIIPESNLG